MRILLTGHGGFLGAVLVRMLRDANHGVVGLDNMLTLDADFGDEPLAVPTIRLDVRDVSERDLAGFDAVIHLAGLDGAAFDDAVPARLLDAINHRASARLAGLAERAGVSRFVFASSCEVYGAAGETMVDESTAVRPIGAFAESKVRAEDGVLQFANRSFAPTVLRFASLYGISPRLRGDTLVNRLVGYGFTTGEVLLHTSGTSWRPILHVDDAARAIVCALQAPLDRVRGQILNVGTTVENLRTRDIAQRVQETVPHSLVQFAKDASPDRRNFKVSCDRILRVLPDFAPRFNLRSGIAQLYYGFRELGMSLEHLTGVRFDRTARVRDLSRLGALDADLRLIGISTLGVRS